MEKQITIKVSVQTIQLILTALSKLPYEHVAGPILDIKAQAENQLKSKTNEPQGDTN